MKFSREFWMILTVVLFAAFAFFLIVRVLFAVAGLA